LEGVKRVPPDGQDASEGVHVVVAVRDLARDELRREGGAAADSADARLNVLKIRRFLFFLFFLHLFFGITKP
jgi:hypothetical protein